METIEIDVTLAIPTFPRLYIYSINDRIVKLVHSNDEFFEHKVNSIGLFLDFIESNVRPNFGISEWSGLSADIMSFIERGDNRFIIGADHTLIDHSSVRSAS